MFKISCGSQAYRISRPPQTYKDLLSNIHELFEDRLPSHYNLEYSDSDYPGVGVIIDNEEEYQYYLQSLSKSKKSSFIWVREDYYAKPAPQNTINNQLDPVAEEPELSSHLAYAETSSSLGFFNDPLMATNSLYEENKNDEGWQDPLDNVQQFIRENGSVEEEETKEEEAKSFDEKVMNAIVKQLPFIISHVEKRLEEKKLLESQSSMSCVHEVQCNGCQKFPIVGTKYQCMACLDFNFCEQCEESKDHIHPFIKVKRREQQDFIHQSLNTSSQLSSIYPGKETIMNLHQVYQAGIKFAPGLLSSLDVSKLARKDSEGRKSDKGSSFWSWKTPQRLDWDKPGYLESQV